MLRMIRIIFSDFFGLVRACGWGVAFRWLWSIATHFGQCAKRRNLQPADLAMGDGPFAARLGVSRAKVFGEQAISGVREIWVRDVYLNHGTLAIPPDGTVVDLGANMGNFTVLALGHGPNVKVVSVEGDPRSVAKLKRNIEANGWTNRANLCTQFIGGKTSAQEKLAEEIGAGGQPQFISEEDFVNRYDLKKIDLIKCDIEGSEFDLFRPGSLLLNRADQLAMELHEWGGDMKGFCRMLESEGFEVRVFSEHGDSAIVQAKRRTRPTTTESRDTGESRATASASA